MRISLADFAFGIFNVKIHGNSEYTFSKTTRLFWEVQQLTTV